MKCSQYFRRTNHIDQQYQHVKKSNKVDVIFIKNYKDWNVIFIHILFTLNTTSPQAYSGNTHDVESELMLIHTTDYEVLKHE